MSDDLVKRLRGSVAENLKARIEALERENRLYRIMVEDCDRQRKTQYDRAEALEQRLDATKDKAEDAILDLMAERNRIEARLAKAVEVLRAVDALDPEGVVDGCSQYALRGLVLRMGEIARDTLVEMGVCDGLV